MKAIHWVFHFYQRVRYPATLPKDIATDLGIPSSHFLSFDDLFSQLTHTECRLENLRRYMLREEAEAAFHSAQKHDKFGRSSLFSYYFKEGWLEFSLHFDEHSRLRRIYLQHRRVQQAQGIELRISRI